MKNELLTIAFFLHFFSFEFADSALGTNASLETNETSEQTLIKKYFIGNPDPRVKPYTQEGESILVRLEYVVLSLININQREQQMVLFGWINMRWNNTKVTWNNSEYDVKFLVLQSEKIWFPNFAIRNSAEKVFGDIFDHEKYRAQILSTGLIAYSTAGKTTTFCSLDLTYFPFDSQVCYLEIFSWTYTMDQLRLDTFGKEIDRSHFNPNGQWKLLKAKVRILSLNVSGGTYSVARFMFHLERKPRYFVIILVIPCTVMSFLVVFVFLLPADSTEKISLSITTLLAYSVFQLTVSDNMPKTSSYIPLITVYISFVLFFSTLSLLSTIFVLMLHHHVLMERPPGWLLRCVVSSGLSRFLGTNVQLDRFSAVRKSILKRKGRGMTMASTATTTSTRRRKRGLGIGARRRSPMDMWRQKKELPIVSSGKLDPNFRIDIDSRYPSAATTTNQARSTASTRWKRSFSVLSRKIAKVKEDEGTSSLFDAECLTSAADRDEEKVKVQWMEIVATLDRLFFVVYTTINLVACLLTFVILPYTAPSPAQDW